MSKPEKLVVEMISSKGCKKCTQTEEAVRSAALSAGVTLVLKKLDWQTSEAVSLAVKHGLSDLPSIVIGGIPIMKINEESIRRAMLPGK